ncbi:integumentary mucin A.1 [Drosophila innubila]|uniref:integumentary mucin A.1 n=1 Tax=Drosophila innubila TaxID=198719 RepID=UPI00148CCD33|nr:integumentary mucin A.1 [Drosophila innubila]
MHSTKSHIIFASTFLLLIVTPACFADLMCYVCEDCNQVDSKTPLLACNEGFFNQGGSTEASTVTTTTASTTLTTEDTTVSSEMTTTSIPESSVASETTSPAVEDTTTPGPSTTEIPESTVSTEPAMPTPATVGPPETTTGVPTPPNEDMIREVTRLSPIVNSQPEIAAELPIRQRRSVIDTDVSYHCYSVKKTFNNTVQTERGCSRVPASQSVCKDLELQNNDVQLSNCDPCSMNACNSASSVVQSTLLGTFLVVLVAALLQRY